MWTDMLQRLSLPWCLAPWLPRTLCTDIGCGIAALRSPPLRTYWSKNRDVKFVKEESQPLSDTQVECNFRPEGLNTSHSVSMLSWEVSVQNLRAKLRWRPRRSWLSLFLINFLFYSTGHKSSIRRTVASREVELATSLICDGNKIFIRRGLVSTKWTGACFWEFDQCSSGVEYACLGRRTGRISPIRFSRNKRGV